MSMNDWLSSRMNCEQLKLENNNNFYLFEPEVTHHYSFVSCPPYTRVKYFSHSESKCVYTGISAVFPPFTGADAIITIYCRRSSVIAICTCKSGNSANTNITKKNCWTCTQGLIFHGKPSTRARNFLPEREQLQEAVIWHGASVSRGAG